MVHWRFKERHEVFSHPRLHAVEDEVELPDGTTIRYLRFIDERDYVTVIAKKDNLIVMIRDYSYPNDEMLLQFPEGLLDPDESPTVAAVRELEEETGFSAGRVQIIGRNLAHHRRSTAKNIVLTATELLKKKTHLESEEAGTETVFMTEAEIDDSIANGTIIQKNALAAWAIYSATSPTRR
jgi:8-oxo-dGTP pyrophosphatase MutT (NUDIX family)